MPSPKKIVLLGATGSIGDSTLKVIRQHPDKLQLVGIAANRNQQQLAAICQEFNVAHIGLFDASACDDARHSNDFPSNTTFYSGITGLCELAALSEADATLVAVVGTDGLRPALAAIEAGKELAIASKEILVLAGKFIMEAAARKGVSILPVDSEHNAIFQCLQGIDQNHVEKIILTASGGPFRDLPLDQFSNVTLEQALKHPNWDMGPKITLDSATMANKGLEMIEARWLFQAKPSQIDVIVHPPSIVHSMVQCIDGSVLAQLCPPDMTFAIQHALLYPGRSQATSAALDFTQAMQLEFRPLDDARYPCLGLARHAMEACGVAPGIYNAANEIAVDAFVKGKIRFTDIAKIIEKTLEKIDNLEPSSLEEVLAYDAKARQTASDLI
ncbi:MAG: 1-deoxy-D-xylulose-5-phosphate reductoisomerase [Verrucomicrobiota bacterium]